MPSSPEAVIASVLDEHTLLGLVGLGSVMHPEVDTYISTLNDAGVRVVHFSDAPLREAKSYAAHVGLSVGEINSCVSLSESEQRRGLGFEYKRAMLPRGIREIRNHLRFFDTVPLQVPLYCDATPSATRAMLSIMQDNHEVVCAFGSARTANIRSVVQASVAVTVEPDPAEDMSLCSDDVMNRINEEPLAAVSTTGQRCHEQMTRLSNSLAAMPGITARFGVPMLALLIREARVTAARLAAATEFAVQASCAIALFRCSTLVGGFQEGLDRGATLFALYVVVPLLTVGVLLAQHPAANSVVGQLKKMPSKHNFTQRIEMLRGWALWFVLRYALTIIMLFAVHLVDFFDDRSLLRETVASNASMLAVEALELQKRSSHAVALVVCTVFLAAHALCHTSTYATLSLIPAAGRISLFQCRFTLLCGAAAVLLSLAVFHADGLNFGPFAITAVCVYTPLILLLDVLIKRRRLNRMQQRQKYLKLVFSTRLGMHSPVGQLEEVAPEITANKPCASRMGKWASLLFWATCLDGHGDGELQCECCSRPLDRS